MESSIRSRLTEVFSDAEIDLQIDGNRVALRIVSNVFQGLSRVQRQQKVYGCLNDLIESGTVHAITISAKTADEQ